MSVVEFPKLGLSFDLDKVAFTIGGLDIAWYAVLISSGFLLAVIYALFNLKRFGLEENRVIDVIIGGMIGGIIGARLYYVVFSWDLYKDNIMEIFNTRNGGLAIYGGIIGAVLVGSIVCKFRKVKLLPMFDVAVLGFLIGQGIGRWGNFVNVEAYGAETNSIFGMISSGEVTISSPVHPCFLYESVWCILGFIVLHLYSKHRKFDGELSLFYLMWYGFERAIVEGLRQDSLYWGPFRVSQILSVILVITAFIVWITIKSKIKRNNDSEYLKLYVNTEESKELIEMSKTKKDKHQIIKQETSKKDEDTGDFSNSSDVSDVNVDNDIVK